MAEEGKKISFGFSKFIKKPVLKNVPSKEQKKVDYIECVDENSIKIVGGEEKKDEPLVIPMLGSKTWHDRIINKVDADIFEPKVDNYKVNNELISNFEIKKEKVDIVPNGDVLNENVQSIDISQIKKEPTNQLTLDEQAAREIISDLQTVDGKVKEENVFTVPITNVDDLKGKEESSLTDYENIPIDVFGLAMLRGMGWQPGKGIGKNEKVVPPSIPELRPKGMGLGADKLVAQKLKGKPGKEEDQLKLLKGGYVKVVAGKYSGNYGKVEGFDEDAARIILKLALGSEVISVNEFWVQPVTSSEYLQNSKVLNVKKYEEYKNKEKNKNKTNGEVSNENETCSDEYIIEKLNEKSRKKSRKKRHKSSDDERSLDKKSKIKKDLLHNNDQGHKEKKSKKLKKHKRQNSSSECSQYSSDSSNEERKRKKSKKLKKHKTRDSSVERSTRRSKKKDKAHEKMKHKKSDYLGLTEISKSRNRKSRSQSKSSRTSKRSQSRSPTIRRRSRSKSPRNDERSLSNSPKTRKRSRSNSSKTRKRSRSNSPKTRKRSRSNSPKTRKRSRSNSPKTRKRSRSNSYKTRKRSHSNSPRRRRRSRSKSRRSHRRSLSNSSVNRKRSRSHSPKNHKKKRSRSRSSKR